MFRFPPSLLVYDGTYLNALRHNERKKDKSVEREGGERKGSIFGYEGSQAVTIHPSSKSMLKRK
jgi:hypothetical protein